MQEIVTCSVRGCPGLAQAHRERRGSLNGVWICGGRCGVEGMGAHLDPSMAAVGWRLPGEMFANRDATSLPISVIRATLQTQLGRERQGFRGPQSCFQPPGLSPDILRCPSDWHGSCPCFALRPCPWSPWKMSMDVTWDGGIGVINLFCRWKDAPCFGSFPCLTTPNLDAFFKALTSTLFVC